VMEILLKSKKEENNHGCRGTKGCYSPVTASVEKRPCEQEKPSGDEIDESAITTEMVEVDEERAIKFCQPLTNSYENIKKSSSRGSSTVQQPQQEPIPANIDHHHHRPSTAPQQCYCGHCCYIDGCQGHESCFETAQAATAAETEKKKKADRKAKKILTCIITSMCLLMDCLLGIALGAYFVLGISVICCL